MIVTKDKIKGQVLIEVLVALSASVLVLGAITVAVVTSLNSAQLAKNQTLATQYAQDAIEQVKELSETDWATFNKKGGSNCLQATGELQPEADEEGGVCPLDENNFFKREIIIYPPNPNNNDNKCQSSDEVEVKVSWTDNKCQATSFCHNVDLKTCLGNLNEVDLN